MDANLDGYVFVNADGVATFATGNLKRYEGFTAHSSATLEAMERASRTSQTQEVILPLATLQVTPTWEADGSPSGWLIRVSSHTQLGVVEHHLLAHVRAAALSAGAAFAREDQRLGGSPPEHALPQGARLPRPPS